MELQSRKNLTLILAAYHRIKNSATKKSEYESSEILYQ